MLKNFQCYSFEGRLKLKTCSDNVAADCNSLVKRALISDSIAVLLMKNIQRDIHELSSEFQHQITRIFSSVWFKQTFNFPDGVKAFWKSIY